MQELVTFDPSRDILWTETSTQTLDIGIGINLYPVLHMTFPSRAILDQFVEDLIAALGTDGTGTVILTNLGPQASTTLPPATTTGTTAPTTSTTTASGTTTTTTAAPTTTTTTLAITAFSYSVSSNPGTVAACAIDTMTQTGYSTIDSIVNLNGYTLYSDSGCTTPVVGDGGYYTITDGVSRYAVQIAANGLMSNNTNCGI